MKTGRSIHTQTVETIAGWIINGRFSVGENLPIEPAICAELGVSRTVVREAIKTLVAKGLVSTGPRIGTKVLPQSCWNLFDARVIEWRLECGVDAAFVKDLMELRLAIEPAAARLAARREPASERGLVRDLYRRMEQAAASQTFREDHMEADLAFHVGILRATGNQFFLSLVPLISSVLRVSFRLSTGSLEAVEQALPVHRAVAEAIAAGDGDRAARHLTQMIEHAREEIEAVAFPRPAVLPASSPDMPT
ncbi:FadR/GntR family transcriptional regulator [Rhabdaerophilum sp. SD176]|uniref:FadR/GntR family transcriptional regulator n=1 Tax=Rhabdaerophilum sp. SD176 TaxID=2983548 RepID=UPI0024DFBEDE|nr:FadR/GntR family transcriptional regulator [Rhabdaerophilum sp. SD176]